jgi:hypothetical protein
MLLMLLLLNWFRRLYDDGRDESDYAEIVVGYYSCRTDPVGRIPRSLAVFLSLSDHHWTTN